MFESEAATRRRRIDPRLKAAGWSSVIPFGAGTDPVGYGTAAVAEYQTAVGPADDALCSRGSIVGVVGAKKLTVGPGGVLTPAQRYSPGVDQRPLYQCEFGVRFLYSTNGERIFLHDVRDEFNRSREVSSFHTRDALREMRERDFALAWSGSVCCP